MDGALRLGSEKKRRWGPVAPGVMAPSRPEMPSGVLGSRRSPLLSYVCCRFSDGGRWRRLVEGDSGRTMDGALAASAAREASVCRFEPAMAGGGGGAGPRAPETRKLAPDGMEWRVEALVGAGKGVIAASLCVGRREKVDRSSTQFQRDVKGRVGV